MTDQQPYTPTTEQIELLVLGQLKQSAEKREWPVDVEADRADFRRWLATIEAAAEQRGAARALREAAKDWRWSAWADAPRNPIQVLAEAYTLYKKHHDGMGLDFNIAIAQVREESEQRGAERALRKTQKIIAGFEHTIDEARNRDDMINTGHLIQEIDTEIQDLMESDDGTH